MFIPHGKNRLLECSALDFGQEIREFLICGQLDAFFMCRRRGDGRGGAKTLESAAS